MGLVIADLLSYCVRRRYYWLPLLVFCLGAGVAGATITPPFYKVTGKGAEAYLLGSIHVGQDEWYPLPEHIQEAFEQCGRLAVELDVDAIDAQAVQEQLRSEAKLEEGQSLFELLPSELYFGLDEALYPFDIHLVNYDDTEPWYFLLILSSLGFAGTDYSPDEGVDVTLIRRAKADGKEVTPLETIEQQLGAFSDFDMATQIELLQGALEAGDSDASPTELVEAWQSGDEEALEALLAGNDDEVSPAEEAFRQALIVKRNQHMAEGIDQRLQDGDCLFVVVGALHIVGKDSIADMLEARGYTVTRAAVEMEAAQ